MEDKKKFNFKEYYASHPEFQKRHKEKLAEEVTCTCGKVVQKGYLSKHMKSKMHEKNLVRHNTKDNKYEQLFDELKELKLLLKQK
jgi:hypothetical protein